MDYARALIISLLASFFTLYQTRFTAIQEDFPKSKSDDNFLAHPSPVASLYSQETTQPRSFIMTLAIGPLPGSTALLLLLLMSSSQSGGVAYFPGAP